MCSPRRKVTIFLGLVMIALPVGIIANAFNDQIHRRDFVVSWSMVAKVPLFATEKFAIPP